MALYDAPPHRVDTYTVVSGTDAAAGVTLTYSAAQSSVPCSIDTASSREIEEFATKEIVVTHKVAFLASVLTTPLTPGMKLVSADRNESFHVQGISTGRTYGSIPAFVYAFCEAHAI